MKSDILIKDDIYNFIKGAGLHLSVNGKLCKEGERPKNSLKEDIVISVISNENGQIQPAIINVNIYVQDNQKSDGQFIENTIRLRELCSLASNTLEVGSGDDFRFTLSSQRVIKVDTNEHVINNKLVYKQINEN